MTPNFRIVNGVCTCTRCDQVIDRGATDWRPRSAHICFSSRITNTTKDQT